MVDSVGVGGVATTVSTQVGPPVILDQNRRKRIGYRVKGLIAYGVYIGCH